MISSWRYRWRRPAPCRIDVAGADHQRLRRFLWTILVSATSASMAGNIARALAHLPAAEARGPILAAAIPPLALLALTHLIGMWSRIAARGLVYWCFLLAVACINAAAFRLSFDALRALAVQYGYGHADAALFPLILDGLVAVCTLGLVVLSRIEHPDARDGVAVQPVPADADFADDRAADEACVTSSTSRDAPAAPARANGAAVVLHRDAVATQKMHLVRRGNGSAAAARQTDADRDAYLRRAHALVDAGRTSSSVEVVHQVLARTAGGQPSRVVADEVGISASSVQRIVKASREAGVAVAEARGD